MTATYTAMGAMRSIGLRSGVLFALLAFASAAWAQAGYLDKVSGDVLIQRVGAKAVPAKAGQTFDSDTVFRTGPDAKVTMKFADGQLIALSADSVLRIGAYRYIPGSLRLSSSATELTKGEMRFVAGLIGSANREGVRITAGASLVGIQSRGGADFVVGVNPEPKEVGYGVVAHGEVSVQTPYGPIQRIASDQYVPWRPGRAPQPPMPFGAASATVQAAATGLWATLLPPDTPVAVESAAQNARAAARTEPGATSTGAGADSAHAGYVDAISNSVTVRGGSGGPSTAKVGDTFKAGTTFDTGKDGRVVLKFADGQIVVLGPNSTLGVDQYQFDPNNIKSSQVALDLKNGAMRFISGAIQEENHAGVSIAAGASLVDILNIGAADFTVVVNSITRTQEIGLAAVVAGDVAVHTPYGPIDRIKAGEAAPWRPGQTPQEPQPLGALPADITSGVTQLAAVGLPENTPVAVDTAAQAAKAVAAAEQAVAAAKADPANAQLRAAAQAASEQAAAASKTATEASQSVAATLFATVLANLPSTAAGPAQAQAPVVIAAVPPAAVPPIPLTTPGPAGTCSGSTC